MLWLLYNLLVCALPRVFQIAVRGGGREGGKFPSPVRGSEILLRGGDFFTGWWRPEEEWFWQFKPFSKLKTVFCYYRTSIKIKLSMDCVSKEYEIKTKMVQEQWLQLKKWLFYWAITWKFTFGGVRVYWGRGNEQILGWLREPPLPRPHPYNRENPVSPSSWVG